jgi:hypothetical protein
MGAKCESKKSVTVSICPYSEIHKERTRKLDSKHFIFSLFKKKKSPTRNFNRKVQPLHYPTVKKDHCRGITVAVTKTFSLGFKHIKANVQNSIFLFH